ncbi:sigma-54-dependent transcriptional regulator [Robertkochia solimangrovi]|uniref:sigma-54-dependent transcriptional regulator n=1 Tax=Robertkochia solimangrovi TaxID=2213046 RepID=UPI001180D3D2|nr:sigma-54 dependent transcriptional regulator [Robertkochia solimangrovi]TRZ45722.1 sigma-54-dependent Fis family transcriptional regulator [Robertkochia solimangrovi]
MLLKNASILVIDDDEDVLMAMRFLLKPMAKEVVTERKPEVITTLLRKKHFDVIILDMNFEGVVHTGNEGLYWLGRIKEITPETDVVLITAYADIDLAIRTLKEGASDFLVKPWKNEKLIHALQEILGKKSKAKEINPVPLLSDAKIIGESDAMKDVFLKINKVAPTDANVLILGENGTGKDLIAKAIHENSGRKDKPFLKVDAGALTASLFESELFGHKKGAYTDAREDRAGRFEAANGGTLFLDEIGNITLQQQAKLLSVLQNRQVIPLGSNTPIPVDIRLICATNVGLKFLADESRFRKDLVYRINTVEIDVPPLRERNVDIKLLAAFYLELYSEKYFKPEYTMTPEFLEKLESYSFPGNVRELQYTLERAVIMADTKNLSADDLIFSPIEKHQPVSIPQHLNLEEVEKQTILKVIEKNKGNISKSAKDLGITRTALYRRLNKYGI